jgi:hypothetical protein
VSYLYVSRAKDYALALRRAFDARVPFVIDVDVSLDVHGYRSIWYPYPTNFYEPWVPGPLASGGTAPNKQ